MVKLKFRRRPNYADGSCRDRPPRTAPPGPRVRGVVVLFAALVGVAVAVATAWLDPFRPSHPWEDAALAGLESGLRASGAGAKDEGSAVTAEAVDAVRRLIARFAESPDAIDAVASLYDQLGQSDLASACWQHCLELDPRYGDAHYSLGRIAGDQGDHEQAAGHFRQAMHSNTTVAGIPRHLAEALLNLGKTREAVELLQKDLQADPKAMATLFLLGQAYLQLRDWEKARDHYEAAIAIAPEFSGAYFGAANACSHLGHQEKRAKYVQKFKVLKAKEEQAHRESLKTTGETADVRARAAQIYTSVGKVYYAHGDAQTAHEQWRKAASLFPGATQPGLLLAWSFERQGRPEEAAAILLELKNRQPQDLEVLIRFGMLRARLRRWDDAEGALRKAIEVAPMRADGYAALADLYLQAGLPEKLAEAKTLAQKAADLQPAAQHFFLLALASRRLGDLPGSRSAIDRAVALEPGNAEYLRAQDSLRPGGQP